jgi:pimeloyl-ACP methyl ester carboxylesterase
VFTLSEVLAKRKSLFRMTGVLRSIQVPTLVLRGEQDNVCRSATKLWSETIPGARAAVIPRAGHMAPLEAPTAFSEAIRAFVQTCPASATLPQISRAVMTRGEARNVTPGLSAW